MNTSGRPTLLRRLAHGLALLGALVVILAGVNFLTSARRDGDLPLTGGPAPVRATTHRQVAVAQERLRLRPADPEIYVQLGGLYLQQARETGDLAYHARAEAAASRALELSPSSTRAMTLMGALMLAQHRFAEAIQWAERALAVDPDFGGAHGVLGDAQGELGQYPEAIASYQTMVDLKPNLESYARVSHARKLLGDVAGAMEAMELAVADGPPGTESSAWATVQLGDLYLSSGRADQAAQLYQDALVVFPDYYLALAALGKARAAQGRYDEATRLYQQAIGIVPQPAALAALGDLYARAGLKEQAQLQYGTVEVIARLAAINRQVYNRELALFYADHDLKLAEALSLAQRELEVRQDIYGYDALAWTLYKNHRPEEAAAAMISAMKLGTQDPMLYYHAGMIFHRLRQQDQARQYLEHALALNPGFSVLGAEQARQTLAGLEVAAP